MKEKIFYVSMYLRLSRDAAADGGSAKESGGRVSAKTRVRASQTSGNLSKPISVNRKISNCMISMWMADFQVAISTDWNLRE